MLVNRAVNRSGRSFRARSIRPKFPEIPVQNRMEQTFPGNSFRKLRFTFRGCPFFWKFGNSGNFLYESAPVPLAVKSYMYKMAASVSSRHYTGCKIMCHSSSLFLIAYSPRYDLIFWKIVDPSFRISRGLVRSVCILPGHTVRKYLLSSRENGV